MKTKGGYSATSRNPMFTWNNYKRNDTNSDNGSDAELSAGECPMCQGPLPEEQGKEFPFCSTRCQMADLGNWLGENYKIA